MLLLVDRIQTQVITQDQVLGNKIESQHIKKFHPTTHHHQETRDHTHHLLETKEPMSAGAGTSLLGSLKALDLSFEATYVEVKARYKILARTYHPDVHRSEVTGLTPEGATQHMQMINSSYEYLREYFERGRT